MHLLTISRHSLALYIGGMILTKISGQSNPALALHLPPRFGLIRVTGCHETKPKIIGGFSIV